MKKNDLFNSKNEQSDLDEVVEPGVPAAIGFYLYDCISILLITKIRIL